MTLSKINNIGLDNDKSNALSEKLNLLLSNFQIFYINTRGLHWNIAGQSFFELHLKFEEIYNDALVKVDEIAERILTLQNIPLHTFSDYLSIAEIKEEKNITNGRQGVQAILKSLQTLIQLERSVLNAAENAGDEGTGSMMSDYIREQEKLVWMFSAYLKKE